MGKSWRNGREFRNKHDPSRKRRYVLRGWRIIPLYNGRNNLGSVLRTYDSLKEAEAAGEARSRLTCQYGALWDDEEKRIIRLFDPPRPCKPGRGWNKY